MNLISPSTLFLHLLTLLGLGALVSGLGSQCSAPVTSGTAAPSAPFWMEQIQHQGSAPFNSNPGGYQVFRNVKDFGAKGDGVTDDTVAINNAIASGNRCGNGCGQSTTSPAVVYFPQGTYLVSAPIVSYFYTQLIGDAKHIPSLVASPNFQGIAVIDADPGWYVNQNNFYHSIRNFHIDVSRMPTGASATGIHWQVSQATSLINIVFQMSTAAGNAHQGIWMENGSGGFMGDLVFNGGKFGMWVGNQQFTVRNITVNNANTAVYGLWNWGWTFQGVTINNCQVGFDLATGGTTQDSQGVQGEAIIDAVVTNTPVFVRSSQASNGALRGSLVLNNIKLNNVPIAVGVVGGAVVLNGGTTAINSWAQGNVYTGTNANGRFIQSNIAAINKAGSLLDSSGRIFGKTHPQYANYAPGQFISVKSQGAKGDGQTDDTAAIQAVFDKFAGCRVIFFDAGVYVVTNTITIPAGSQVVGEAWSTILGTGNAFFDYNNPKPVIRAGASGSQGVLEISDMIFSTRGPTAGAIVLEWNVHDPAGQQGAAGTWDTHIILGGKIGTNLQANNCPTSGSGGNNCFAAFLALHLTPSSSAYLEGLWVWTADHDLDQGPQIDIYTGRGIMSESQGPVWMIGTASEHNILYQYYLVNAQNHYMGLIQTETPYFQPNPVPPAPFIPNSAYKDPSLGPGAAWALTVSNSQNILVFGAGLYSFFQNYGQGCLNTFNCQQQIVNIDSASTVAIYSLSTVASQFQISVNGQGVVPNSANRAGFAQTVTSWTRS
ncbi:exo-beta-1,3-glucanase [Trametes versicolor FP-101664 SS1]|uniref:exo-beta-1,3-glucanase n=1 Tax=Trametes versicolor (strain FP-101664) TaxID=717944 RepID=UPI0004624003|nr:exo-beta-1,3-glucanase [Trametes versicolor FP-101664 SS1]EIW63632.1 exo-beta-1,3-glucanase [Trametes versicolor FP-101664 SS1]